ncbi:MFS transporter permease [Microbulbifer hydrolyticus]|uniref:MFS transporter permease n=1 Tax=Microbulbifer hydrolyticus TaxID=48074 RepID=A0ABX6J4Z1_9GAMM|nr:MFS transporter permease [Microbulbifer hydrolyticus]
MMDLASYSLQDFIPFTADVYFRLLARMGEAFWPLQSVTLLVGFLALFLSLTGRVRIALGLLAPLWAFVGVAFFAQRYSGLNWAGTHICWIWLCQGLLLLLLAVTGWGTALERDTGADWRTALLRTLLTPSVQAGLLIALCGLLGFPLLGVAMGNGWPAVEVFGLHPDPTAAVTLGLLLVGFRGSALWFTALVPTLWLCVSALTLKVLGAAWYPALLVIVAVAVTGSVASYRPRTAR